jgi:hypothetical protein
MPMSGWRVVDENVCTDRFVGFPIIEPDTAAAQVRAMHAKVRPVGPVMPTSA